MDSRGRAVEGFVGRYERQLDPKGRVALPATFRNRLEPRCYLTLGSDKCIGVVTAAVSMDMAQEMTAAVKRGEKTRSELRALAVNMVEVQVDAQGRITIDANLRAYAGLSVGARVVVSGAFDSVEIWEPERFERMLTAGTEAIAGDEQ
ncbi:MAG: division/cell wall cluster transcriptional repressor MraZ [Actinomycetota bacterium]